MIADGEQNEQNSPLDYEELWRSEIARTTVDGIVQSNLQLGGTTFGRAQNP